MPSRSLSKQSAPQVAKSAKGRKPELVSLGQLRVWHWSIPSPRSTAKSEALSGFRKALTGQVGEDIVSPTTRCRFQLARSRKNPADGRVLASNSVNQRQPNVHHDPRKRSLRG
jgi:hypothetical protein